MKFALVNPAWTFEGSTYFGCRDPHYPLELLFAHDQIVGAGHESLLIDAQTDSLTIDEVRERLDRYAPGIVVIPTAPSYLFGRCPQPELRIPMEWFAALGRNRTTVAIGPHGSATPAAALRKLNCDVVMRGEPDQTLARLASEPWELVTGACFRRSDGSLHISPELGVADMRERWGAQSFTTTTLRRTGTGITYSAVKGAARSWNLRAAARGRAASATRRCSATNSASAMSTP